MRPIRLLAYIIFLLLTHASHAGSHEITEMKSPNVMIGLYPYTVRQVDMQRGSYIVRFIVWFRWKDKSLHPHESFRVKNGVSQNILHKPKLEVLEDGTLYSWAEMEAIFNQDWDLSRYPFDSQELPIEIEEWSDYQVDELLYGADSSNIINEVMEPIYGWTIDNIKHKTYTSIYKTSFGVSSDATNNGWRSSTFNYTIILKKDSLFEGFKLIITPLLVLVLLLTASLLHASERISISTGAMFTSVAAHFVIVQQIPSSSGFSCAEKAALIAVASAVWYTVFTIASSRNNRLSYNEIYSVILDRINISGLLFSLLLFAYVIYEGLR